MSSKPKRQVDPVRSDEDFQREVRFILETIFNTSSMNEKLPNYLVDRVFECIEWGRKNIWK